MNSRNSLKIIGLAGSPGGGARLSASDWAFQDLWSRIVRGELAAGSRMTEDALAELLDVSRTPLREAIVRLQEIGLLQRQRNRGLQVTPLSAEDAEELTLIREHLEVLVARLAARNAREHPSKIDELQAHVLRMKALQGETIGAGPVLKQGDEFHAALLELAASSRLHTMLSHIYLAIERYRYILNENKNRASEIADEHEKILLAVASGDETAAAEAMSEHIAHARKLYIDQLRALLGAPAADITPGSR